MIRLRRMNSLRHSLKGKRVLVRVDFNVPLNAKNVVTDDTRIRETLPTIEYLQKSEAILVLMTHLGRPDGKKTKKFRLAPVGEQLARLLHRPVVTLPDSVGPRVQKIISRARRGEIFLLENLRFSPFEENNDVSFAKELACGKDLYVNEAFSNCHRRHASMDAITKFLPSFAGLLLQKEIAVLEKVREHPGTPSVAIVGGAKIESKVPLIKRLLLRYDTILLGGGVANTVLLSRHHEVGRSMIQSEFLKHIRAWKENSHVLTPVDAVVSTDIKRPKKNYIVDIVDVDKEMYILDIGPQTIRHYESIIEKAKTIVWSGPVGMYEVPFFAAGTKGIVKAINNSRAFSVVGGGDTIAAIDILGSRSKFSHVSTGGSAMLQFLAGEELPALKPLIIN